MRGKALPGEIKKLSHCLYEAGTLGGRHSGIPDGQERSIRNEVKFGNSRPRYWYYQNEGARDHAEFSGGRIRGRRLEMKPQHPLAIRWCHWVNSPLLALMI
jgi:hypothetical protein